MHVIPKYVHVLVCCRIAGGQLLTDRNGDFNHRFFLCLYCHASYARPGRHMVSQLFSCKIAHPPLCLLNYLYHVLCEYHCLLLTSTCTYNVLLVYGL